MRKARAPGNSAAASGSMIELSKAACQPVAAGSPTHTPVICGGMSSTASNRMYGSPNCNSWPSVSRTPGVNPMTNGPFSSARALSRYAASSVGATSSRYCVGLRRAIPVNRIRPVAFSSRTVWMRCSVSVVSSTGWLKLMRK